MYIKLFRLTKFILNHKAQWVKDSHHKKASKENLILILRSIKSKGRSIFGRVQINTEEEKP